MSRESQNGLDPDTVIAERVRQQLVPFTMRFADLGDPGELRDVLNTTTTLHGPKVRQKPETFTEQYLIEPVLHALGYWNPMAEEYGRGKPHYIRQPSEFRKVESKRPDYKLENIGSSIVAFVEAKAAGNEQLAGAKTDATDDIEAYLEDDIFCKILKSQDHDRLVGIGTDGLRWTFWTKCLESGEVLMAVPKVDISPVIKGIAKRTDAIEGEPEMSTPEERRVLCDSLVPAFAARNLEHHAGQILSK